MVEKIKIDTLRPDDFDEFWARQRKRVHDVKNKVEIESIQDKDFGKEIHFYFYSVDGAKLYAKLFINSKENKPLFVYYHGHNSNLGDTWVHAHIMNLVNAGFSCVAIDMRHQSVRVEDPVKYDILDYTSTCYNILDVEHSYMLYVDLDALKIIDIVKDKNIFSEVADKDIYVAGHSQGGGLAILAAAQDNRVKCALADIPSEIAIRNRIKGCHGKYTTVNEYIKDHPENENKVYNTVDYLDVVNMYDTINCPIIFGLGDIDEVCPTRFTLNLTEKIKSKVEVDIYHGGHGGFEDLHLPVKINFANNVFKN